MLLDVAGAAIGVRGLDRARVPLSPLGTFNDIGDDDPETTFPYIAESLSRYGLAYLHLVNPATAQLEKRREPDAPARRMLELMRTAYRGTLIIAGGFDHDTAEAWLQHGRADLSRLGRKSLTNPDLTERFRLRPRR